jgi:hypothetical protein
MNPDFQTVLNYTSYKMIREGSIRKIKIKLTTTPIVFLLYPISNTDKENRNKKINTVNQLQLIHGVTIKFPNFHSYSNTTKAIYRRWTGLVREIVYLYDV